MTGDAAGKVWIRSQASGTAGAGWSGWKEITGNSGIANKILLANGTLWDGKGYLNPVSGNVWDGVAKSTYRYNNYHHRIWADMRVSGGMVQTRLRGMVWYGGWKYPDSGWVNGVGAAYTHGIYHANFTDFCSVVWKGNYTYYGSFTF